MPRMLFDIPNDQAGALRDLSARTGVPVVQFVRQAISNYLQGGTPCGIVTSGSVASGCLYLLVGG